VMLVTKKPRWREGSVAVMPSLPVGATVRVVTTILVVIPIGAVVAAVVMPLLAMVAAVVTIARESCGRHREQHHEAQAERKGGVLRRLTPAGM